MLCRELSSFNWNGFVILRCLRSFWWHAHCQFGDFRVLDDFGLDRIWTCETEFEQFWCQLSWVLHWFSFCLHDMSMGFVRRNHCDLFCSHVKGCACIDSWLRVNFACWYRSVLFWFLSETLKFGWLHITCQDVRHASWGNIECDLYRKCGSSVKVCVTHLRMRRNEFEFSWNGWVVVLIALSVWIGSSSWIADYAQVVFGPRPLSTSAPGLE